MGIRDGTSTQYRRWGFPPDAARSANHRTETGEGVQGIRGTDSEKRSLHPPSHFPLGTARGDHSISHWAPKEEPSPFPFPPDATLQYHRPLLTCFTLRISLASPHPKSATTRSAGSPASQPAAMSNGCAGQPCISAGRAGRRGRTSEGMRGEGGFIHVHTNRELLLKHIGSTLRPTQFHTAPGPH